MSRNIESRFALAPRIENVQRSSFNRDSSVKTTFNVGELVPFFIDEVLPGDTYQIKTSKVVRMQTLVTPMMDNLYLDTYYFFVPNRIVWEHWKELMGENTTSAWIPKVEYSVPQVSAPEGGWQTGTIADYFGIPTKVAGLSVNALPFRAYAKIVNEWFRDQNLQDPVNVLFDDSDVVGSNGSDYVTDIAKGGMPFVAAKYHDYFTSALPAPQKGPDVSIGTTGEIPVFGTGKNLAFTDGTGLYGPYASSFSNNQRTFSLLTNAFGYDVGVIGSDPDSGLPSSSTVGVPTKSQFDAASLPYSDTGLVASVSSASGFSMSVNSLRTAFQIQKLYERDALSGTRYREILKSHFGVTSPDSRQQVPEYLGGNRLPINVNQVVQQSGNREGGTPQGHVAGYSLTTDSHGDFIKSFTEHGFIIGLMVARYDHTYQQGLQRFWSRKDRFDYYWPVLSNIGEQPILNKEIYAQGTAQDDEVFGYQEAWADYRYKPSIVTGEMRSNATPGSLHAWHLADNYSKLPMLSAEWIQEDMNNVDRVLAVQSSTANQLFGDFHIACRATRCMPLYSVPGLIDHH